LYSEYNSGTEDLDLYFSSSDAAAAAASVAFNVYDCGTGQDCSGASYEISAATVNTRTDQQKLVSRGVVNIDASWANSNTLYKLVVDSNEVDNVVAFEFKFVAGVAVGLEYANTWGVNSAASSASSLAFDLDLDASIIAQNSDEFKFTMCACSPSNDDSPNTENTGSNERYFTVETNTRCTDSSTYIAGTGLVSSVAVDLCHTKCQYGGSVGDSCFGWSGLTDAERANAVCAADVVALEELCQLQSPANEEFSSQSKCVGFDVQEQEDGTVVGHLLSASCTHETDESFKQYSAVDGRPCTDASDYAEAVGEVKVTEKFLLPVDYVWTPDQFSSIEILAANGESLTKNTGDVDTGLSGHRIMVIDCMGTCGISDASEAVEVAGALPYNQLIATNQYYDPASDDDTEAMATGEDIQSFAWTVHTNHKCTGDNDADAISPADVEALVMTEHAVPFSLATDTCHYVCSTGLNNHPACEAVDMEILSPNAICATVDRLKDLAARIEHFSGSSRAFSIHSKLGYGYIYEGCNPTADPDQEWDSYVVSENEAETRRLTAPTADNWPLSFSSILRFVGLKATSGGTFKVCACDHEKLSSNVCRTKADFQFEVGKIHSSGVSCLISNPRFQKVTCKAQYYEGYRCKNLMNVAAPSIPQDSYLAPETIEEIISNTQLTTFCAFQPEELAQCQIVAEWQSRYGSV